MSTRTLIIVSGFVNILDLLIQQPQAEALKEPGTVAAAAAPSSAIASLPSWNRHCDGQTAKLNACVPHTHDYRRGRRRGKKEVEKKNYDGKSRGPGGRV